MNIDQAIARHTQRDLIIAMIAGLGILLGFVLLLLGVAGSIDLGFEFNSVNARLVNASPGALFAACGFGVLGLQARFRPKVIVEGEGQRVELHESGPHFIFPGGANIRLYRDDRLPGGDHYYGDEIDGLIDELGAEAIDRDAPGPGHAVELRPMRREKIQEVLGPVIDAWVRSAQQANQAGRVVQVNVDGKLEYDRFSGGHSYEGPLPGRHLARVLTLLTVLSKVSESG